MTDDDEAQGTIERAEDYMMLMAAIEGLPIKFPFDHFMATREAYKQMAPS